MFVRRSSWGLGGARDTHWGESRSTGQRGASQPHRTRWQIRLVAHARAAHQIEVDQRGALHLAKCERRHAQAQRACSPQLRCARSLRRPTNLDQCPAPPPLACELAARNRLGSGVGGVETGATSPIMHIVGGAVFLPRVMSWGARHQGGTSAFRLDCGECRSCRKWLGRALGFAGRRLLVTLCWWRVGASPRFAISRGSFNVRPSPRSLQVADELVALRLNTRLGLDAWWFTALCDMHGLHFGRLEEAFIAARLRHLVRCQA